eukprot:1946105-Amphidinium_carterae.1
MVRCESAVANAPWSRYGERDRLTLLAPSDAFDSRQCSPLRRSKRQLYCTLGTTRISIAHGCGASSSRGFEDVGAPIDHTSKDGEADAWLKIEPARTYCLELNCRPLQGRKAFHSLNSSICIVVLHLHALDCRQLAHAC